MIAEDSLQKLKDMEAYIFDLDGCIYTGSEPCQGAAELIGMLKKDGKMVLFLTNNSMESSRSIREKLLKMGIEVEQEQIIVATELTGAYLLEKYGKLKVFPVGSETLTDSLKEYEHRIVSEGSGEISDYVVVGLDKAFSYERLYAATQQLRKGAKLLAANLDANHPGEEGDLVPETGAILASIKRAAGVIAVESVGKPSAYIFRHIVEKYGLNREHCLMVGDNPGTDIEGAYTFGMRTCWLSRGMEFPTEKGFLPEYTFLEINELLESWKKIKRAERRIGEI